MPEISVVIPTLGRPGLLARVLDRLDGQTEPPESFTVIVVADAAEPDTAALDRAVGGRRFRAQRLQSSKPGASAARNLGWRTARSPIVLFLDDDILPERDLVREHLAWHRLHPAPETGVLGHVRWADELRVTPFMQWLEDGIQFNYPGIEGTEADWGWFYTANVSVKTEILGRARGFEEDRLPFGYEDLDLALRMREFGFSLLYNRAAVAEHVHPMDLGFWRQRVARIARSEREFTKMHPEVRPYFYEMFTAAAAQRRALGWGDRVTPFVPRSVPLIGPLAWASAGALYRQRLAGPFLEAWHAAAAEDQSDALSGALESDDFSASGSRPGGPK
ncbi:MAG: glycosyltransferase family 2 protein [Solirubrobacteraceae bacterium]